MSKKIEIRKEVLSNGLNLIAEYNPDSKSAALGFFVKTGARDEIEVEAGISHFLEHMMFKGTDKRSALDVTYDLGNIGAQANAYTSDESTVYYSSIIPEYFNNLHELLSDMIRPALDQKEFDTEKKVILEEIALYQDKPYYYLYEKAINDYYRNHKLANSVLGTHESVSNISRDLMKDYFDRRYSPSNMVLVASGNFNIDDFFQNSDKYSSSWKNIEVDRDCSDYQNPSINKTYTKKDLNQVLIYLINNGVSIDSEHRYPLNVLTSILGDQTGSKLYWELIASGLADSTDCESEEKDGSGFISAFASCNEKNKDVVVDKMKKILSNPMDFTEDDLEQAKNKIATKIVLSGELPIGRLMSLRNKWIYQNKIDSLSENLIKLKNVTREEIRAASDLCFSSNWSEFVLMPKS